MIKLMRPRKLRYMEFDRRAILICAQRALHASISHITDVVAPMSAGGKHDFYSNADYWWPDESKADGLPYIKRDGESYPGNFFAHRIALRKTRSNIAALAAAYALTGEEQYAEKAVRILYEFFLDEETKMHPSLWYAQAIPGRENGRGIGIIDTVHLIDIPFAIEALKKSVYLHDRYYRGLQQWFGDYMHWILDSPNGQQEMQEPNNHAICCYMQLAVFALFTGEETVLEQCRQVFVERFLREQMDIDGSFPLELRRTKPYSYSIMVVDALCTLCYVLSDMQHDLWHEVREGRSVEKAVEFIVPYMMDKKKWFLEPDVEHFESLPVAMPFLLFAGEAYGKSEYFALYESLPQDPQDIEIRRNIAIRQPLLWLMQ